MFIFLAQARASSKVFSLALAVGFALVTAETASAWPKKHCAERPVAPRVDRSLLPATLDESGTPIIMQGLPKTARPERGSAEGARGTSAHDCARQQHLSAAGSVAPGPPSLPLQPALPVYKPPPINSVGDRVTNCRHSFPLNAGLGSNPSNRDFYVRSCANN